MQQVLFSLVWVLAWASISLADDFSSRRGERTDQPPTGWTEASGHRVIRLSQEPGSKSLYFHQNAYTADGDKMVFFAPSGLSVVDLETRQVEQLAERRISHVIVGRKTRQVFYLRGRTVLATSIDTGATRTIAELPDDWSGGAGFAINADETLLAGSANDGSANEGQRNRSRRGRRPGGRPDLEARLEARIPMVLYTVEIASGEVNRIHSGTDWFNHLQFSPTDPTLLMFCHEGPWHKVDRIWTIQTDGENLRKVHSRTMPMEIAGHEFFDPNGETVWYDLQTPKGKEFWLTGANLNTGEETHYPIEREHWSVHYNIAPDGKRFAGDGGGPRSVAAPGNGQRIYLFTPRDGKLEVETLVDLSKHDYALEPNVTFMPDGKRIVFSANIHGDSHVYAVEVLK